MKTPVALSWCSMLLMVGACNGGALAPPGEGLLPDGGSVLDGGSITPDLASSTPPPPSNLPCADDPLSCPTGETCWYTGTDADPLRCKRANPAGQRGDVCATGTTPTCDVGLLCGGIPLSGEPPRCLGYCHPAELPTGCLDDEVCHAAGIGDALPGVCIEGVQN